MAVVLSITSHEFSGGPSAHKAAKTIVGEVSCANPYAQGGELFGAAEIQAAIRTALGRTDINITTVDALVIGECSDQSRLFKMNAAETRVQVFNRPAPSAVWSAELAAVAHVFTLPANTIPLFAEGIAGYTAPLLLQYTAGGAAGEAIVSNLSVSPVTVTTRAADACTAARFALLSTGALVEQTAADISTVTAKFIAVVR